MCAPCCLLMESRRITADESRRYQERTWVVKPCNGAQLSQSRGPEPGLDLYVQRPRLHARKGRDDRPGLAGGGRADDQQCRERVLALGLQNGATRNDPAR